MIQRKILLQNGWLHLPIGRDAQRRYVRFEAAGQPFAELYLGLSEKPDFHCGMELNRYLGQEIAVAIDEEAPGELLDGIQEGGAMDAGNPLIPVTIQRKRRTTMSKIKILLDVVQDLRSLTDSLEALAHAIEEPEVAADRCGQDRAGCHCAWGRLPSLSNLPSRCRPPPEPAPVAGNAVPAAPAADAGGTARLVAAHPRRRRAPGFARCWPTRRAKRDLPERLHLPQAQRVSYAAG